MLREVFRTVPVPYMTEKEYGEGYLLGQRYSGNKPPWVESISMLKGLVVSAQYPMLESQASGLYLFANTATNYWPSWDAAYWTFDGHVGKFQRRIPVQGSVGTAVFQLNEISASRKGAFYSKHYYQTELNKIGLGATATALKGEEPSTPQAWIVLEYAAVKASKFGMYGIFHWAIDEIANTFLHGSFREFQVFNFSTGAFKYTLQMPENIVQICLEDSSRCYVLCGNQTVILLDYVRGEVLGVARIPAQTTGRSWWNAGGHVVMTWDTVYRRLLLAEKTPDNADGSSSIVIRGFSMVNEPCRITQPIPLRVPRVGRTVPVLVQIVDERNAGVGRYVVEATVS